MTNSKHCLIFGGSGQIGRNLIRKLTKNNYRVTVVTRNIHQKSYIIKTQANAGYIDIVEANIFDEKKIRELFKKSDICVNLIGILFEKKRGNTFKNIHTIFPSLLAKLSKEYNLKHFTKLVHPHQRELIRPSPDGCDGAQLFDKPDKRLTLLHSK